MGVFDVARLRRVMLARPGLPVLRADTQENPVGKNGVMTPVKCQIEALIIFFRMVKEWSVRFSFWSGQWSGQTSVKLQTWSNLVKALQTLGNVSRTTS